MYEIKYEIRNISPLVITHNVGDQNMVSTMDYINGSAVLGIFANKYIKKEGLGKNAHKNPNFYSWFLNSELIFSNAYLLKEGENEIYSFLPPPLSIQTKKKNEKKGYDLIYEDNKAIKRTKNMNEYSCFKDGKIYSASPEKSITLHHDRLSENRVEGRSMKTIFNYESMDSGQIFRGVIKSSKNRLDNFLEGFDKHMKVNIGRSRTVQYGHATIEIISECPKELSVSPDIEEELEEGFILTFTSPAIIYNEYGFSSTSREDIKRYIGKELGIKCENINFTNDNSSSSEKSEFFVKSVEVESFVSVWKLRKPSETAFKSGSCFSLRLDNINDSVTGKFTELQKRGIGERCGEGFGQFRINLQRENTYEIESFSSYYKNKPEKPEEDKPPELTENIFREIIKNRCRNDIETKALGDSEDFGKKKDKIPSNSLLSRLEAMITNSDGRKDFLDKFEKLRDTAGDNLKSCNNTNITLYQYIKDNNPNIKGVLGETLCNIEDLEELYKTFNNNPAEDTSFHDKELYQLYWITFFRMMRKSRKKEN